MDPNGPDLIVTLLQDAPHPWLRTKGTEDVPLRVPRHVSVPSGGGTHTKKQKNPALIFNLVWIPLKRRSISCRWIDRWIHSEGFCSDDVR